MIFLAPIPAIIAAAITGPALLALYFLKLRRRPARVTSTLLWESAIRDLQANAPFRWLRPSLLLLLQLLALASLLIAFARPALDSAEPPAGRVIILIDRSASMSAPAESVQPSSAPEARRLTRLDSAKRQALDLIDRAVRSGPLASGGAGGRRSQVMVIAFAADARALTPFTADGATLRRAVESIEATDQPDNFALALRLVEAQTMSAGETEPDRPRVFLFSDGALSRSEDAAPAGVGDADFRFVRAGPAPEDAAARRNVGIVALSARRDYDDPALVRLFVRLLNAGSEAADAALTVRVGDRPVSARSVLVPARSESAPGEAAVTFDFRDAAASLAVVSLARPDYLAADDAAAVALEPLRSARILLVRPPTRPPADRLAEESLIRALEEIAGGAIAAIDAGAYEGRLSQRNGFSDFDLLVFDSVRPTATPPAPSISFGAGLPIPGVSLQEPPAEAAAATRVLAWRRTSPFLRDVSLDNVLVAAPPVLTLPDIDPSPGSSPDASPSARSAIPLATGPSGPLIAALDDRGRGRVIVAFPLAQSTWTLDPGFPVFLANAVEELTSVSHDAAGRLFTTADPIPFTPAPGAESIALSGPATVRVSVGAAEPNDREAVLIGPLTRAGVYRAEGVKEAGRPVPVNLVSPRESAIATSASVEVAGRPTFATRLDRETPREIWHWFAMLAAALLTVEWVLFAARTRI